MKKEEIKDKILNDPDFIWSPKYENSLDKFAHRHDEGVDNNHAAKVLLMEPEEVESIFQQALEGLRKLIGGGAKNE